MYLATKPPKRATVSADAPVIGPDHLAQILGIEAR